MSYKIVDRVDILVGVKNIWKLMFIIKTLTEAVIEALFRRAGFGALDKTFFYCQDTLIHQFCYGFCNTLIIGVICILM